MPQQQQWQDNRQLTRRWFEEVWNQGRVATIDKLMAPDAIVWGIGAGGKALRGPGEFRKFYQPFRDAFSNFRVVVDDVLADGEQTVTRLRFSGRNTGDGLGVPPTGRAFASTAIIIARWRDGQIVEAWNEFDAAGMMQQLTAAQPQMALRP